MFPNLNLGLVIQQDSTTYRTRCRDDHKDGQLCTLLRFLYVYRHACWDCRTQDGGGAQIATKIIAKTASTLKNLEAIFITDSNKVIWNEKNVGIGLYITLARYGSKEEMGL